MPQNEGATRIFAHSQDSVLALGSVSVTLFQLNPICSYKHKRVSFSGKLLLDKISAVSYSIKLDQCLQSPLLLLSQDTLSAIAAPDKRALIALLDEDCISMTRSILLALWLSETLSQ